MSIKAFLKPNKFKIIFTILFPILQIPMLGLGLFSGGIFLLSYFLYFNPILTITISLVEILGLMPKYCDGGFCILRPDIFLILLFIGFIYTYPIVCLLYSVFGKVISLRSQKNRWYNKKIF